MKLSTITSASVAMLAAVTLAGELHAADANAQERTESTVVEPVVPGTDFTFPGYVIGENDCYAPDKSKGVQSPGTPALFV